MKLNKDYTIVKISTEEDEKHSLNFGFTNENQEFYGWETNVRDIHFVDEEGKVIDEDVLGENEVKISFEYTIINPEEYANESKKLEPELRNQLEKMLGESLLDLIMVSINEAQPVDPDTGT